MYPISILRLDKFNYPKFSDKIIDLYLHAFTTGKYAQHINPNEAENTLDELMQNGFGSMAFIGDRLAGVAIALPLRCDAEFPKEKCPQLLVEKSLYIAEVMVHAHFRGYGIASQLLDDVLAKASDAYTDAVIRVWRENCPALSLYQKMGFCAIATISQTKFRAAEDTFEMEKVYLLKKITP